MSRFDGLTHEQNDVLFTMICSVIRRACYCHRLENVKCHRCGQIDKLTKAFPEAWAHAADITARTGLIE